MLKRTCCLIVVICVLASFTVVSFGTEVEWRDEEKSSTAPLLRYSHIHYIAANLEISKGTATCVGIAAPIRAGRISVVAELQRNEGGSWKKVTSWSGSADDIVGATVSGSQKVTSGYLYRVEVTARALDSNNKILEEEKIHSNTEFY